MIRVDDILKFDILKDAKLVAGQSFSQNVIQSINVMDAPDIVRWVKKNELLLTTGYPIKMDRPFVEALISGLKERGCAALGIKIKRFYEHVPDVIIEVANEHGLPVIELPYEITFSQIITQIMEQSIGSEDQSNSIKDLIDEGLEEQKLDNVIRLLSQILDRAVSLESDYLELPIAFRAGQPDDALMVLLRSLDFRPVSAEHAESAEFYRKKSYLLAADPNEAGLQSRTVIPVRLKNETIGKISIWYRENELPFDDWNRAIDYALSLVVFLLKEQRSQTIAAKKVKAKIIGELIRFDHAGIERLEKLAEYAGILLRGPFQVITLASTASVRDDADDSEAVQMVFRLDRHLHRFLHQEPLIGRFEDHVVLVLYRQTDSRGELANRLAEAFSRNEAVRSLVQDHVMGISDVCTSIEQIRRAYHEALLAIAFAREKGKRVMKYTQFGLLGPFLRPEAGMGLSDLIGTTIRPILDAAEAEGKLLVTLQAYFRNNENLVDTSRELFLHRNSLKYRLEMIEKLTGLSLDRTEDKFRLFLGVKAYEILKPGSGEPAST